MLPATFRYWLFDTLSVQTMRYVSAVPNRKANGLTGEVYQMIREDFFKNGSLTSRSKVPEVMAAIWTLGREAMLVEDRVDRTTKDAISAVLSQRNDCPYCEDMLISLVHAGGEHDAAPHAALVAGPRAERGGQLHDHRVVGQGQRLQRRRRAHAPRAGHRRRRRVEGLWLSSMDRPRSGHREVDSETQCAPAG